MQVTKEEVTACLTGIRNFAKSQHWLVLGSGTDSQSELLFVQDCHGSPVDHSYLLVLLKHLHKALHNWCHLCSIVLLHMLRLVRVLLPMYLIDLQHYTKKRRLKAHDAYLRLCFQQPKVPWRPRLLQNQMLADQRGSQSKYLQILYRRQEHGRAKCLLSMPSQQHHLKGS